MLRAVIGTKVARKLYLVNYTQIFYLIFTTLYYVILDEHIFVSKVKTNFIDKKYFRGSHDLLLLVLLHLDQSALAHLLKILIKTLIKK